MCAATVHRLPTLFAEPDPWLEERVRNAPLFELPWEGNDELRPIRTTKVLRDASDLFKNGMWDRLDWFVDGQEACYLWTGVVKAAVTLRTDPLYGWSVREVSGVGGALLPPAVEDKILGQLAAAGFRRRAASFPL
ncbi:MAG: hypothetical protein IT548_13135 [Alphaproteobacteria bacterium]|nr:hypothetical protein [Alphaproteobacteria bacterium]